MMRHHLQLLNLCTKRYTSPLVNQLLLSCSKGQLSTVSGAAIKRPKELDEMRKRIVEYKGDDRRRHSNDPEEDTGLYGYFLLTIPIITFGLGTWQVWRRNWKLQLIEDLQGRLAREPIEIPELLDDLQKLEYCPIKVRGEFLYEHEFAVGPRSLIIDGHGASEGKGNLISGHSTNRGYNIITPFKVEGRDLVILVNRGWVPNKYKHAHEREKYQLIKGTTEIVGINRLNEIRPQFVPKNEPDKGVWHYRDLYQMAEHAHTEPIYLEMLDMKLESDGPVGSQTRVNLRNEHLSYIFTWYSLSAITGYYWYRIFIKKRPIF